jgi:F0F1-type ATP synthase assembly protein I
MSEKEAHGISHHILAASTTLLGISFAIVSLIGAMGHAEKTLADEFALVSLILFLGSCVFAYASMRFRKRSAAFGRISDTLFFAGLISLCLLSILLSFNVIR